MKCFFTVIVSTIFIAGLGRNADGQSGGAGASGGTGASATASGTDGAATTGGVGVGTTPGTAGTKSAAPGATSMTPGGQSRVNQAIANQAAPGQPKNGINATGQNQIGQSQQQGYDLNGPSQTPWFNDQSARQQLNMNDPQFNQLNGSYQAWNRYHQGARNLGNNLNEQQRMQQMQQLRSQFNQQFGQSLDSTFTDPQARQRYNQLNNQFYGFNTFNDPAVSQRLNITPQQRRQLQRS